MHLRGQREAYRAYRRLTPDVRVSRRHNARPASGGASSPVTLDNASILDKSATLTKVGTLQNLSGTPILTDDATGHFILRAVGATWEIQAGLVITDRAIATSHNITVTDANGAHVIAIAVVAITAATLGTGGSVKFPRRNGETAANFIATSVGLYGVMGANVASGEDGAISFFWNMRRGSMVSSTSDLIMAGAVTILGTGSATTTRGFHVHYFAEDSTAASGTALKGRICFSGGDHAGVNKIGLYLTGDADGVPTGSATNGSYLRSAVINDDVDRLVVLRYTKNGATWNGVAQPAMSMQVITIRLDTFAIEYGDVKNLAAWVGMGTNASKTNALSVGTYTGSTQTLPNYSPCQVSDINIIPATGSDADWVAIAKGADPGTQTASAVRYKWALTGPGDLTQTAGSQTASSFTVTGTVTQGRQMKPSLNGAAGLTVFTKGVGYVFGLQVGGATSRSITQDCNIIGAATHVDARVSRAADNAIVVDWVRVSTATVTGLQTFTVPGVPVGLDWIVELRRDDDHTVVAVNRSRARVGFKIAVMGQSQQDKWLFDNTANVGIALPTAGNVSFALHRPRANVARCVDIGVFEAIGDMAEGFLATAERLGALAPTVPFLFENHVISGESLGTFYGNQSSYGGTYRAWGDYGVPGTGLISDLIYYGGTDISFFLHMHGTADVGKVYSSLLSGIYGGVDTADCDFSCQPSNGGPTTNVTVIRSYTGAGLDYPIRVAMIPLQRHGYVQTGGTATQAAFDSFRAGRHLMRQYCAQWVPPGSITTQVVTYTDDIQLLDENTPAHQTTANVRGNPRIGHRYAMAVLSMCGLSTHALPAFASATRVGNVITLVPTLANGGALFTPSGLAPTGFEVSEDGGGTWFKAGVGTPNFTPAISGGNVTLTRGASVWPAGTQVRHAYGGPVEAFTVSQSAATRLTNYGLENTDLDNAIYESRTDAAPSNGGGYVQGVPFPPHYTPLVAA